MSIPILQEHKEAEQAEADRIKVEFMASLPAEERAKFEAVDKAAKILVDADVMFYLFPYLPERKDTSKKDVWQWNSLMALLKYDESGKPMKSSEIENRRFHEAFFTTIFNQFRNFFQSEDFIESLDKMKHFFWFCLDRNQKYRRGEPE